MNIGFNPWRLLADRKSTRLNSSHANISYAVFCLKKKSIRWRRTGGGGRPSRARGARGRTCERDYQACGQGAGVGAHAEDGAVGVAPFFFLNDRAPPEISLLPPPPLLPI